MEVVEDGQHPIALLKHEMVEIMSLYFQSDMIDHVTQLLSYVINHVTRLLSYMINYITLK